MIIHENFHLEPDYDVSHYVSHKAYSLATVGTLYHNYTVHISSSIYNQDLQFLDHSLGSFFDPGDLYWITTKNCFS